MSAIFGVSLSFGFVMVPILVGSAMENSCYSRPWSGCAAAEGCECEVVG